MSERATVFLARYSCYAQLLCTAAMHRWYAQLLCTAAKDSWYAQLIYTADMHSCYAQLLCTAAMHSWYAQLLCTAAMHSYYTALQGYGVVTTTPYSSSVVHWACTVKPSKFNICVSSSLISINVCKEIGLVFSCVYIFGWVARWCC